VENKGVKDKMSETEKLLSELIIYVRGSAAAAARPIAAKVLDSYEKAIVYSKLDGKTSQPKIEAATSVPQRTISDWLGLFVRAGLASEPSKYFASHKALFSLEELNIDLTSLRKKRKPSAVEVTTLEAATRQNTSTSPSGEI